MLPDRVSNPGPLTYESGALPIALRGPATTALHGQYNLVALQKGMSLSSTLLHSERPKLYRVLAVLSAIGLNKQV